MKWALLLCVENFFLLFPAQLLQFSLFFWLRVQKCFSTVSYFPWCLLFKKKIKVSDLRGTPIFFLVKTHIFSHLVTAVGHLYAFLPPVGLPLFCCLSFSLSSLAFLLGTVFTKAVNLQKPFFCYWSGLFWVGLPVWALGPA